MISVIVPTMWKYLPFLEFAEDMVKLDIVDEIIIINNDSQNTPNHEILKHPKVKLIDLGKNLFVNPSWNYGTHIAKNDKLCFLSDDLIFDIKLFFKIDDFLTEDMGAICLSEQQAVDSKVPMLTGNIKLTPYTGQSRFGYGVVFFMHKKQWIDVPYELLVFYGDNFIFDQTYYRGLQNYMIDDLFHYHAGAQTSGFITENGKKDDQYINKECEAYFTKIQPKLINRELS